MSLKSSRDIETAGDILDCLYDISQENCEAVGGYPDDIQIVGDRIFIATVDDNGPRLEHYDLARCIVAFRKAKKMMAAHKNEVDDGDMTMREALEECGFYNEPKTE